jgi:phosphohistidine phosphatase
MHRLILLRHAKSDWPAGVADHERPLNKRGRRSAPLMGRVLAERGDVPDRALVSDAQRTRETWERARDEAEDLPLATLEPRLYMASAALMMSVIGRTAETVQRLAVVGHNPGTHALAASLVAEGDEADITRMMAKYPTAGLAVIDCDISRWSEIKPKCGKLVAFLTPRDVADEA